MPELRERLDLRVSLMAMAAVMAVLSGDPVAWAQPAPVMVTDHTHGMGDSPIGSLAAANGRLVFAGPTLSFSDGTPEGTEWPAPCAMGFDAPFAASGLVFFIDGSYRPARTDGTCEGTFVVADDAVRYPVANPSERPFVAVGGQVYFFGSRGLWKSDGTPEGTALLRTFTAAEGNAVFFAATVDRLYFETDVSDGTAIIWTSDGTVQGTVPLARFAEGANGIWARRQVSSFAPVGDRLFFSMYTPGTGVELWMTDGTAPGTAMVADLLPGPDSSDPLGFAAFQGRLAFVAPGLGSRVHLSDGTAAGTAVMHDDLRTFGAYMAPYLFTVGNTLLVNNGWFAAEHGMIATDGTPGGTALISRQVTLYPVRAFDGIAYFQSSSSQVDTGDELFQTDGTAAGTGLVADICPGPCYGLRYSESLPVTSVGGAIFMAASDGVHGLELWRIGLPTLDPVPTTKNDTYTAAAGATLTVPASGVLANDLSNGGGPLTAQLVVPPTSGSVVLDSNGGFTFSAGLTAGAVTFTYRAVNALHAGAPARVVITVTGVPPASADDHYVTPFGTTLNVGAPGVLVNDNAVGAAAVVVSPVGAGSLALASSGAFTYVPPAGFIGTTSFTYRATSGHGAGNVATATITVGAPTAVQPPTGLMVQTVVGNAVTLRWTPPAVGPVPSGWVFEGGVDPGQSLVSLATGQAAPLFTFSAPGGSYYLRIRAVDGLGLSGPSNEVRVFVAQPLPPAAPSSLLGLAHGSALALTWRAANTGGEAAGYVLDVSGALAASLPLDLADTFSFDGVPAGTYTFAVRAVNAFGSSPASNPVTLTFPDACSGLPDTPVNVLAYRVANVLHVRWDAAESGAAPTSYAFLVTGTLSGALPLSARTFSAPVSPGSYGVRVVAVNACGHSAPSAVQMVTVP